jgi:hypothetical protein
LLSGLAAAKEKVATLVKDQHQLLESVRSDDRFLEQLKEVREKLQSLETGHGVYGKIADLACGDNQLRITYNASSKARLRADPGHAGSGLQQKSRVGKLTVVRPQTFGALSAGAFGQRQCAPAMCGPRSPHTEIFILWKSSGWTWCGNGGGDQDCWGPLRYG